MNISENNEKLIKNNSERPVDALAVKKYQSPTDNFKSRDASASKNAKKTTYRYSYHLQHFTIMKESTLSYSMSEGLVRVHKPTKYLGDHHQPLEQHGSWFLERQPAGLRGDKVPLRGASYGRMHRSRGLGIHQVCCSKTF